MFTLIYIGESKIFGKTLQMFIRVLSEVVVICFKMYTDGKFSKSVCGLDASCYLKTSPIGQQLLSCLIILKIKKNKK